jgi:hypothetical protein
MAPGYSRLDSVTGSILWIVSAGGKQVDLISRRRIADECRRLTLEREVLVFPAAIQTKLSSLPKGRGGVRRVIAVLDDGTTFHGVHVGWGKEILYVEGYETVPFAVDRVSDVKDDSL